MDYNITYRKKDKGWQYIISRKDEHGKWKQIKSKQGFKTKNGDAKPAAEEYLKELKSKENLNQELQGITFKEFTDMYLEHIKLHMHSKINIVEQIQIAYQTYFYQRFLSYLKKHLQRHKNKP